MQSTSKGWFAGLGSFPTRCHPFPGWNVRWTSSALRGGRSRPDLERVPPARSFGVGRSVTRRTVCRRRPRRVRGRPSPSGRGGPRFPVGRPGQRAALERQDRRPVAARRAGLALSLPGEVRRARGVGSPRRRTDGARHCHPPAWPCLQRTPERPWLKVSSGRPESGPS